MPELGIGNGIGVRRGIRSTVLKDEKWGGEVEGGEQGRKREREKGGELLERGGTGVVPGVP